MSEIIVAFWSGTGNTAAMAELVGRGIEKGGKTAKVIPVENLLPAELKDCLVFAMGCPSMGDEVLEEGTMEDFVTEVEGFASGKKIGLFGSYGWGDGEWMRNWVERMEKAGAAVIGGEGVICNGAPEGSDGEACISLGEALSKA